MNYLAQMIWAEARGESDLGKRAVAHVALNRLQDSRFSSSLKGVITKPGQFTYKTGYGKIWDKCLQIADDPGEDPTEGALYFSIRKTWPKKKYHGKIGNHYFFS